MGADKIGVQVDATSPPRHPALGGKIAGAATGAAILLLALLAGSPRASALEAPTPPAQVSVTSGIEEGKKVIVATVTRAGKPVEGAHVVLQVRRTFGNLTLGEDDTLADGTMAVQFPADLPGGPDGKLQVIAQIKSPVELASTAVQTVIDGALQVRPEAGPFAPALWAPNAPLGLVITICSLLAIVWTVYGFVIVQLVKIKRMA